MHSLPGKPPSATPGWLLAAFVCIWAGLAIAPHYRADWLLENIIVFVALPLFIRSARRWRFSDRAYACLFAFLVLHSIGAHYTYSEVPYDAWARALTGRSINDALGWDRNHYDRLVHFSYGLLLLPASIELFDRVAPPRGFWRTLLPVLFIMSHSVIYELIEWGAALLFGGDLGQAYLGTQGDVWDAQKDTALATLGAVVSMAGQRRPGAS
jgi:putative membrane protein